MCYLQYVLQYVFFNQGAKRRELELEFIETHFVQTMKRFWGCLSDKVAVRLGGDFGIFEHFFGGDNVFLFDDGSETVHRIEPIFGTISPLPWTSIEG